ncbi:CDP-alcohol phosphatidyltransferase family protein [Halorubrum lacusprofundi]|jgi:CDP-diacylglycerol--glycerol-3-phosphate 3-phosphatidyltransferase|uniref:CDP-alcohol phosphatidyltransferase n=1 Tax=Halorubrum lacusprofundi (strain ATCC 49239 / DSM 5036 / JCM 8891 / ACAM 34) TaxID=416348 RepID=B9LTI9_HALLT|nr:CDP-alcohol phosphatidyltransferase family protein [Halorubrum lacusprofundi]ACM56123.1 CDP-alcohol phosphatidyltransferase [Halorubrum lacusprofundi ATCC 49239]MCG1005566.1 CDP-alcohol phosphatidyltransferase family protein [Halorubrum lacusprofundi]
MAEARRRRSVRVGVGVGLPLVAAVALVALLLRLFPVDATSQWGLFPAVVAGVCWAGQLWYVGYGLDPGRLTGGFWRRLLGLANVVTLVRGALYAVVAGFVVVPSETALAWVPALCYGTGVALDKLDGIVARTVGRQTELGRRLDMAFDTFGFVVAPLVAVLWGLLPVWYLSISAARYVFRGAVWLRRVRGLPVGDLPDSDLGKYLAGVQMIFVTIALAPLAPTDLVWILAPVVLAPSLAVFTRDYLAVSGRIGRGVDDAQ